VIFFKNFIFGIVFFFVLIGCGSSNKSKDQNSSSFQKTDVNSSKEILKDDENKTEVVESLFDVKKPLVCSLDNRKKFVHDVIHDSYFWADDAPYLDFLSDKYGDSQELLSALKDNRDRFSHCHTRNCIRYRSSINDKLLLSLYLYLYQKPA